MPATLNTASLQLRDLHLPKAITLWPPATGWWVVAVVIILLSVYCMWKLYRKRGQTAAKREALQKLRVLQRDYHITGDASIVVPEISKLLRRTALAYYPRRRVSNLYGERWLQFLSLTMKNKSIPQDIGPLLTVASYQRSVDANLESLFSFSHEWIGAR